MWMVGYSAGGVCCIFPWNGRQFKVLIAVGAAGASARMYATRSSGLSECATLLGLRMYGIFRDIDLHSAARDSRFFFEDYGEYSQCQFA